MCSGLPNRIKIKQKLFTCLPKALDRLHKTFDQIYLFFKYVIEIKRYKMVNLTKRKRLKKLKIIFFLWFFWLGGWVGEWVGGWVGEEGNRWLT